MKHITKILVSIFIAIMMIAVACKKDDPTPTTTPATTTPGVKSAEKTLPNLVLFLSSLPLMQRLILPPNHYSHRTRWNGCNQISTEDYVF